jgi:cytochrome c peroxidase
MFRKVGRDIWQKENIVKCNNTNLQYGIIGLAIAAYEYSDKVNQFSSKYDQYLKGKASLTADEKLGLKLFDGKGKCARCHISKAENGEPGPLFTDFTFENVGVPRNPVNPWYTMDSTFNRAGKDWIDEGLADYLSQVTQYAMLAGENRGKHQVPTLRNVDKRPSESFVKAYDHNGYFKSLKEMVHFYSTRDVLPRAEQLADPRPGVNCWPKPEVEENLNKAETGNLGLTDDEESAIVAFLKTLSDGYEAESQK